MAYEALRSKFPQEGSRCKKLCGKCCTNTVPVLQAEADEIVDWLNKNISDEALTAQFHHFDRNPASCPFLTPEKGCFIYPVRPSVCRIFGHMEDVPMAPKKWSQKCPEGVEFTEVKFADAKDELVGYMMDSDKGSMPILQFRMVEMEQKDGKTGIIPIDPASPLAAMRESKVCTRCGGPFTENNAYLEGAELLCFNCGGKER